MKFYTIKDEEGVIRPMAVLGLPDKYGKMDVENWLSGKGKEDYTIVMIEINEVEE